MREPFRLLTASNGVVYLECQALGASHGFSTRLGGGSRPPYDALNLGLSSGDDTAVVRANRRMLAEALSWSGTVACLHQVHGTVVHALNRLPETVLQGDALVTAQAELPIGVFTADCTPILLHDPVTGAVGAVHAGWRGTVGHVVSVTVEAMVAAFGTKPSHLRAAIGPAIGPCCFEVGPEVREAASAHPWPGWEGAFKERSPRPHFDLFAANAQQLRASGLQEQHIHSSELCTACRADLFFSWRRDQGQTGRLQAVIAPSRQSP